MPHDPRLRGWDSADPSAKLLILPLFSAGGKFHLPVRGERMAARLDFEIYSELETGLITGHAGVPGLIEAFRQTGTPAVIDREIQLKSRKRGLSAAEMAESLLALWAAGGERAEDLDQFRQDKAQSRHQRLLRALIPFEQ